MPNIFYYQQGNGIEYAKWPGVSKRIKKTVDGVEKIVICKVGQRQLGRVLDKEHNIFFKTDLGIYQFDEKTQADRELTPEELATVFGHRDGRRRGDPVIICFGGAYFLDCFIKGIQYQPVLESIKYRNRDRLNAMLQYYLLSNGVGSHATQWYDFNYTKYLYPCANLTSQRLTDFFAAIGRDENRRNFLFSHIKYLLKSTDEELCILVDSTGLPNKCKIPHTRVSNHDGDVNIEFRVIVVVQKSTGLPVYFEMIPGNVVDVNTISTVMEKLKQYGYNVSYALGDAAYSCPSNIERLVLAGIDFLTRLNPTYDMFKDVLDKNFERLNDPKNVVRFNGRMVSIVKVESVVARKTESGEEVKGYIYLCRDIDASLCRSCNLMHSKVFKRMSDEEVQEEMSKYGVFALASTKDIPEQSILKEYYMRQAIEQFFDYAKNYANYLPVRKHNVNTVKGHLLLSFIATFILILIKNKLKILDSPYVAIPSSLADEDDGIPFKEIDTQQGTELMIRQEQLKEISKCSPSALFSELQFHMADVFDNEIVTNTPTASASALYKTYRIGAPLYVVLEHNGNLPVPVPKYKDGEGNNCTRKLAFARRSSLTPEQLELRRRNGEFKKLENMAAKLGIEIPAVSAMKAIKSTDVPEVTDVSEVTEVVGASEPANTSVSAASDVAGISAGATEETSIPKRGRGRPKGSKDKKPRRKKGAEQSKPAGISADQEQPQTSPSKLIEENPTQWVQEPDGVTHVDVAEDSAEAASVNNRLEDPPGG